MVAQKAGGNTEGHDGQGMDSQWQGIIDNRQTGTQSCQD
jgi:hypothetical protein